MGDRSGIEWTDATVPFLFKQWGGRMLDGVVHDAYPHPPARTG